MHKRTGILLINLGTPSQASVKAVRAYLKEFLSDPRVIEIPYVLRWLLLRLFILPFRSPKSAAAYSEIWQESGSPLLVNSLQLKKELQLTLGADYQVELGMRYGQPKLQEAFQALQHHEIDNIIVIPLFPQYASAVSGSALQLVFELAAKFKVMSNMRVISNFFKHEAYIDSLAASLKPYLQQPYDYLLMSYHGLPERQMINPGVNCYRTQCMQTSSLLAAKLGLSDNHWSVSFQSRLGKLPWIKPYTDEMLGELRQKGIDKLLVCCPSFVVDCLETLEEVGIRAQQQWLELGGTSLMLIPCLNAAPHWVQALKTIVLH